MLSPGGTPISSVFIRPRLGGDLALLKAVAKRVLELDDEAVTAGGERVLDVEFIAAHTAHFGAFAADLRAESWPDLIEASGVSREDIERLSQIYVRGKAVIATWGMGLTQHKHAVASVQMLCNLMLMRGNIGRVGAGLCPVRGHSNVQGDRSVGIDEKPTPEFLDRLEQVFHFSPPRQHGHDVVGTLHAMLAGQIKVFVALGGNFVMATPDTPRTFAAMQSCDLTVHIATKLNRSHLVHGRDALILPTLGRTEIHQTAAGPQGVTVEDSMSMVHISYGINKPASPHCLSEVDIVARMAQSAVPDPHIPWLWYAEDHARIRDAIGQVYDAFKDYNARVARPGGFHLGVASRDRIWHTPSGKAEFKLHALPKDDPIHAARSRHGDRVLTLMTTRSHDQYNTTIYGLDDRYRGVFGQRRVIFVNRADLERLGFTDGEHVDLIGLWNDGIERRAEGFRLVEYDIPAGCIAGYYPETNPLVPLDSYADKARTPTSKSIPVLLERAHAGT
jgi:molybdopterin-dependent oxidoreductase alpha subunit